MKKIFIKIVIAVSSLAGLSACSWLAEPTPNMIKLEDYMSGAGGAACASFVTGAYAPLCWELHKAYYSEWFIGDVCSDDALKGGEAVMAAMPDVYRMENFKTIADNQMLLEFYRAQYQGVGRCNLALEQIAGVAPDSLMSQELKDRYLGEMYFLRAFYYFRLVRVFGGVPLSTEVLSDASKSKMPRATVEQVYDQIISDLETAESKLWDFSALDAQSWGHATKGAAQAMLLKAYLYQHKYTEAVTWGKKLVESGAYSLVDDYAANFTLEGENNAESIFEVQYSNEGSSDYSEGNGSTRGTFTTILTRGRQYGGWAWNHPTQNLYDEFESGDYRREATINDLSNKYACPHCIEGKGGKNPKYCSWRYRGYGKYEEYASELPSICPECGGALWLTNETANSDLDSNLIAQPMLSQLDVYLGNTFVNAKTGLYTDEEFGSVKLHHDSRGELNKKEIRYADVLLMYAEACLATGDDATATSCLNQVRTRARNYAVAKGADPSVLPDFPGYSISVNGQSFVPTLEQAIRHERRVELAMECHRWFDLVRWGTAAEVMNAYKAAESRPIQAEMNDFVPGKHELFPIPPKEIELSGFLMEQNPGY